MKIRYSLIAIACAALVGCMDKDWNDPNNSEAYGNPSIKETKVITIGELKKNYADVIASQTAPYKKVENDVQIKGRITGNDIQGNIYNSVCIEDATGGILIDIAQGGLFAYLPVGQEIVVNLKDLYVGSYGQQAAIGTPFTNGKGQTSVSRMNRYLWNEHFNYVGAVDPSVVVVEERPVDLSSAALDHRFDGAGAVRGVLQDVPGGLVGTSPQERGIAPGSSDGLVTDLRDPSCGVGTHAAPP